MALAPFYQYPELCLSSVIDLGETAKPGAAAGPCPYTDKKQPCVPSGVDVWAQQWDPAPVRRQNYMFDFTLTRAHTHALLVLPLLL